MLARRTSGLILALAAAALAIYAGNNESMRRAARREVDQSGREADAIRVRWQAEQRMLEAHVADAAAVKPLLVALDSHIDGPKLVELLQSEDWWREARAEFSLTRVVVGDETLATYGSPDPGSGDQELVAAARTGRIASSLVELGGRPY